MKPVKILMLEDNASDAGLIKRVLEKADLKFESKIVDTKEEFIKGLKEFVPDAVFSDHSLPQFNSLEAFETLKGTELNIPFILITGKVSEEFAVQCLKEGIDDYILKDQLHRLPSSLNNALLKRKLESEKNKLKKEQAKYIETLKIKNHELVKLNSELDRFVYSASHELKAPLTSILGIVYLIESELSEGNFEPMFQYMELIEQSVNRLIKTIEEIVYHALNNQTPINFEIIHPEPIIDAIWKKLKYTEQEKKVIHKIQINKKAEWYSDKNRIIIILEHLISNAIKYRDTTKEQQLIEIAITITHEKVIIKVKDNGNGIHKNNIEKIFNMFYRASSVGAGSGLGLYLVKETVEKLNGTIKVQSEPHEGTTFIIELPNHKNN